jgi:predicted ATPase
MIDFVVDLSKHTFEDGCKVFKNKNYVHGNNGSGKSTLMNHIAIQHGYSCN